MKTQNVPAVTDDGVGVRGAADSWLSVLRHATTAMASPGTYADAHAKARAAGPPPAVTTATVASSCNSGTAIRSDRTVGRIWRNPRVAASRTSISTAAGRNNARMRSIGVATPVSSGRMSAASCGARSCAVAQMMMTTTMTGCAASSQQLT